MNQFSGYMTTTPKGKDMTCITWQPNKIEKVKVRKIYICHTLLWGDSEGKHEYQTCCDSKREADYIFGKSNYDTLTVVDFEKGKI